MLDEQAALARELDDLRHSKTRLEKQQAEQHRREAHEDSETSMEESMEPPMERVLVNKTKESDDFRSQPWWYYVCRGSWFDWTGWGIFQ